MTTTTADAARVERPGRAGGGADGAAGLDQVAPPPKMRRRPAMIALSIALICVGGLASAWAWQSTSNAREVLTVRDTVHRGQVIEEDDLVVVRLGVDPAIKPVPASRAESLVGQRAVLDIAKGGVIAEGQTSSASVPPKDYSVVGLSLTAAMLPTEQLMPGDAVRVVPTAGEGGAAAGAAPGGGGGGQPAMYAATVVKLASDEISGNALVNVQVEGAAAPAVAKLAAAGQIALVLDSQEQ